ncbi:FAD-dependent oxidoreductase [Kineococcus gynurae]|uniref:FAD-dependent oxidoreductase n=1 Tax=Kineococcus gynurae TaxID=452979 RepID=A0ABV5LUK0_9ACTN
MISSAAALPSSAEVVVVGAGVAGLACARHLDAAGLGVVVVEAARTVGGRVRSEVVGNFRVDRGFQLLNPAYPEVRRVLDLEALRLQTFDAGVAVARDGVVSTVRDPRRHPLSLVKALRFPIGDTAEKVAAVRWALGAGSARSLRAEDGPWGEALDDAEIDGELREQVIEPFLAGVLGEADGSTSRRFVDLLLKSFLRGTPGLPARGMQAVPDQLAKGLPRGSIVTGVEVRHAGHGPRSLVVETTEGGLTADAIVVATDAAAAAHIVHAPELPPARGLSTFWYATLNSPVPHERAKLLHLDGDRSGPVVNTAVVSEVAPSYVVTDSERRSLVSAQTLGADTSAATEAAVRAQLGRIYSEDTSAWSLVAAHEIPEALPVVPAPFTGPKPVSLGEGIYLAGDHRENASLQGALVSGRRAADALVADLRQGRRAG